MAVPLYDLNKVQFSSQANSFKNNSVVYQGSLVLSASIPAGSFLTVSQTFTIPESPQFSELYAFFQDEMDVEQQYFVGSGFDPARWYKASVNNPFAIIVLTPGANAGPLGGIIYPVIKGNQITVNAIVNNPYSSTITYTPLTIPFAFIEYTMTN